MLGLYTKIIRLKITINRNLNEAFLESKEISRILSTVSGSIILTVTNRASIAIHAQIEVKIFILCIKQYHKK